MFFPVHLDGRQHPLCWVCLPIRHRQFQVAHAGDRYLLMQVPSNLFLNKIGKPALYLPTTVFSTITPSTDSPRPNICRWLSGVLSPLPLPLFIAMRGSSLSGSS